MSNHEDELTKRLAEVEARERELEKKEAAANARGLRHCLYQHINVPLRTVDAFILICGLLIVGLAVYGIIFAERGL